MLLVVHALADAADIGGDERHARERTLDRDERERLVPHGGDDQRVRARELGGDQLAERAGRAS